MSKKETKSYYNQFFQLVRIGLGISDTPVEITDINAWKWIYNEAKRQAMQGVVFEGVARNAETAKPPRELLTRWLMTAERIKRLNSLFDNEAKRLTEVFDADKVFNVILKGQGNERLYPVKGCRQPGDIDIYVAGGMDFVMRWIEEHGLADKADRPTYQHVHLKSNDKGISIEVHFKPASKVNTPWYNRRLKRILDKEIMNSRMSERGFRVPTPLFNILMQLAHMHCHFFEGGIGLRHVADYYFVVLNASAEDRKRALEIIGKVGLMPMASALMWILKRVFCMKEEYMITEPDERLGLLLLNDICNGGNFGYHMNYHSNKFLGQHLQRRSRIAVLIKFGWSETLWAQWEYMKYVMRKLLTSRQVNK